jgi:hypothetical protein
MSSKCEWHNSNRAKPYCPNCGVSDFVDLESKVLVDQDGGSYYEARCCGLQFTVFWMLNDDQICEECLRCPKCGGLMGCACDGS